MVRRNTSLRRRTGPGLEVLNLQLAVEPLRILLLLSLQLVVESVEMPLVLGRFQSHDPILVIVLEEAMAECDSAQLADWKLISSSAVRFSGTREYWQIGEVVAKMFGPSRISRGDMMEALL